MAHLTSAAVAASGLSPATLLRQSAVSHCSASLALAAHSASPRHAVAADEHFCSAHCAGAPSCISFSNEVTHPWSMAHLTSAAVAASGLSPATLLRQSAVSHCSASLALAA